MKSLIIFIAILILNIASGIDFRVDPLVLTEQGLVRGQKATDGDYSMFLGVPYARVDTENPFGAFLPVDASDNVFNANDGSIACPQSSTEGILDCLRVNIFVPNEANSANPLPVFFWIHGGMFSSGKAPDENVVNIVKHGVVLVTVNYRLGAYGFMCLDDPSVPGNQGLKDQLGALRWIKNNIAAFGGNPNKITVGGQSAGASSVRYHLYSSMEKLFDKVIMHSHPTDDTNGDHSAALKLSQHLGFNATDNSSALKFLANTSPTLIIAASSELRFQFRPCKETSFSGVESIIDTEPINQLNIFKIRNTPIIFGMNSKESQGREFDTTTIAQILSTAFKFDEEELNKAATIVRHFYFGDENINDYPSIGNDFRSDFSYNHPTDREIAKLLSQNASPIYKYVFSYVNDGSEGARHSHELKYLFANTEALNDQEKVVADRMGNMWTNFIKFGNPVPQTNDLLPDMWEPVTSDTLPYMDIGEELALRRRFHHQRMGFWDLFYECYSDKL